MCNSSLENGYLSTDYKWSYPIHCKSDASVYAALILRIIALFLFINPENNTWPPDETSDSCLFLIIFNQTRISGMCNMQ